WARAYGTPGKTWMPSSTAPASFPEAISTVVLIARRPSTGDERDGTRAGLVAGGDECRHREPVGGGSRLLALVEVPPLLAREAVARQRGARRVLELDVDHHDRRAEGHLVGILDDPGALGRLAPEPPVGDPHLPQRAGAVVDVREGNQPRFLVDEDDALRVRVLRQLRRPLDDIDAALLPRVVEGPVDLVVPFHGEMLGVEDAEHVTL